MLKSTLLISLCLLLTSCQAENVDVKAIEAPEDTLHDHNFVVNGEYDPNDHGFEVNDTVPNFKLFDLDSNLFDLSKTLESKEYVLLISGSFTCPKTRKNAHSINVVNEHFPQVKTVIVYGYEAHPLNDGKFGNKETLHPVNVDCGINYPQQETMRDRYRMAKILKDSSHIGAEILVDSKDNLYAKKYGIGPNSAYLIDKNGVVRVRHDFFMKGRSFFQDLNEVIAYDLKNSKK